MNYTGMTKSNYVEVADKEALQDLVDEAKGEEWAFFLTYWSEGQFAIGSDTSTMYIEGGRVDEFLTRLGEATAEPMVIRSVGYEGMRHVPDAWQWNVYPDGTWVRESMTDVSGLSEAYKSGQWEEFTDGEGPELL